MSVTIGPAMPPLRLGVNVDHVAAIRNVRGGQYPDPVRAAKLAIAAGADNITAHLREDRRHIRDDDIARLKAEISKPINFPFLGNSGRHWWMLARNRYDADDPDVPYAPLKPEQALRIAMRNALPVRPRYGQMLQEALGLLH